MQLYISIIILLSIMSILIFGMWLKARKDKKNEITKIHDVSLSCDELECHIREMGLDYIVHKRPKTFTWPLPRLNQNYKFISEVYKRLNENGERERNITPSGEWLLDNFYVIEEQVKGLRRDLDKKAYFNLPVIKAGPYKGYPAIYIIAQELVSHTSGRVDSGTLINYINAYQKNNVLLCRELWALSSMLRLSIIENIKYICEKVDDINIQRKRADTLIDSLIDEENGSMEKFQDSFKNIIKYDKEINIIFCEHISYRLRKMGRKYAGLLKNIDVILTKQGVTLQDITKKEHDEEILLKSLIENSLFTLRNINMLDWTEVFESLSHVDNILRKEPENIYGAMDFESREYYRKRIEEIAKKFNISEVHVAKTCVELTEEACVLENKGAISGELEPLDENTRKRFCHVGYYLIDDGFKRLCERLGEKKKICNLTEGLRKNPTLFYLGNIFLIVGLIELFALGFVFWNFGQIGVLNTIIVMGVVLLPALEVGVHLTNWGTCRISKPEKIMRMELNEGIPQNSSTMVVIPALITNQEKVVELLENLEVYYLANKEENLYFAVAGDYKDSTSKEDEGDIKIIEAAIKKVRELNKKYNINGIDKFYYFHRHRGFNEKQNKWMGWERKRGALLEFNDLLLGSLDTSYSISSVKFSKLPPIKYVITLDADTFLTIDSAKKLIGSMVHPLNVPLINRAGTRVVSGYGLMQPRISVDNQSANKTTFSEIFAGDYGLDPYACAISDIYQDLFKEGIFTGKGVYDLKIFQQLLKSAIPENSILSHDLLEGSYLRTALLTDVELIDSYPAKYNSYAMRLHRWVRGDWQLLPWLFKRVKNLKGDYVSNPLSFMAKWKIFDNLRRSLTAPGILLLILCGFSILPGSGLFWLTLSIGVLSMPLITGIIDCINLKYIKSSKNKRHMSVICGLKATAYRVGIMFAFVPYQGYLMLHAIFITLYRLIFTKRNMLEWVTAAAVEKNLKNDVKSFFIKMRATIPIAIIIFLVSVYFKPESNIFTLPLAVFWVVSPLIAYLISAEKKKTKPILEEKDREYLMGLAERTWSFFAAFTNEENNFLTPDNYQENPKKGVAYRTSPTNIALGMLAVLTAKDFGFIDANEMIERLLKTTETIEKMEKWNGHLYNWYNTKDLSLLTPRYVSTVDNGNFICYLITLVNGLEELKVELTKNNEKEDKLLNDCINLIDRLNSIIENTKFSYLFDSKKQLFSIGYNVEENKLTESYYDLLASEARHTSFIAVARGEVDSKHWFKLGRTLTQLDGYKGLVSWSGTMFEYLMPLLIMKNYKNSLLDETYSFAVRSQKKYAKERNIPWGISESGFYMMDIDLNYQYKAFGVPWLGLKRGLIDDVVVSPYSTVLALLVDSNSAIKNIKALEKEGLRGEYGFYEAVDYTKGRIPINSKKAIVKSYMAHHQGMNILALNNFLNDNILQKRFHASPFVKAVEILLQERVPEKIIFTKENKEKIINVNEKNIVYKDSQRKYTTPDFTLPKVHIMSNGNYSTMVTEKGTGFSKNKDLTITRWREDSTLDNYGMFFYIRDMETNKKWSSTYAPYNIIPDKYEVTFSSAKAKYERTDEDITTVTEVIVSSEENAEIRRVSITNNSKEEKVLEVTSYMETVLARHEADIAHPAFSNLFIRTDFIDEYNCLIATRRPRTEGSTELSMVHFMVVEGETIGDVQFETDRSQFIGRGRSVSNPLGMEGEKPLTNSKGAVLDPVMCLRRIIKISPNQKIKISYITAMGEDYADNIRMVQKFLHEDTIGAAFSMAFTRSLVECRYLNLSISEMEKYQDMISHILYLSPLKRAYQEFIIGNTKGQSALWPYGISGDLPIVLIELEEADQIDIVYEVLKAHEYWRILNLKVDVVIINDEETAYINPIQSLLSDVISSSHARDILNHSGGVFVIKGGSLDEEVRKLLYTVARLVLKGKGGYLEDQIKYSIDIEEAGETFLQKLYDQSALSRVGVNPPPVHSIQSLEEPMEVSVGLAETKKIYKKSGPAKGRKLETDFDEMKLEYYNGLGGFALDGKEYVIKLDKDQNTPAPWINVVANSKFGFISTESGGGYTWHLNSRENKLTPWTNDSVGDSRGEIVYISDENNTWTVTPLPIREEEPYIIKHGFGYSQFSHTSNGISQELTQYVPVEDTVKISILKLKNISGEERKLKLGYYARPVLGVTDQFTANYISTSINKNKTLMFKNSYNEEFPEDIVFLDIISDKKHVTGNRKEFLGNGSITNPWGMKKGSLSGTVGAGFDPCGAMMVTVDLKENEEKEIVLLLGVSKSKNDVIELTEKYSQMKFVKDEFNNVREFWRNKLEVVKVKTPDRSMDIMLNGWLMYQTISCRLWARSGFYQSGGAFGFRDQLQDSLALAHVWPEACYNQILLHSAHQFVEGDVQHWWHEPKSKGTRTKFSDDLLWLPYVTSEYIRISGDSSILEKEINFIEGEQLKEHDDEIYIIANKSEKRASVYEHCIRAIDKSLKFGDNGIPLIGSGDWNDGMSSVGNKGKGESVWLGWFLYSILNNFAPICKTKGDKGRQKKYINTAQEIVKNIEKNAWDGNWYRRAYFDNGVPLGSLQNSECKIDSISQSWAIISEGGDKERAEKAMKSLENYLIRREDGIIKLLTPPFDSSDLEPGYIKGYVPGVRENGGQYTHAAIWTILAFAKLGIGDTAHELFNMINPINHTRTHLESMKYKVEPYVMAADVYSVEPHVGRGGWTWYTGASGWMNRVGLEYILGFKKQGDTLEIEPCIPEKWSGYELEYRYEDTLYKISVTRWDGKAPRVTVDNTIIEGTKIKLVNDKKEHIVEVEIV